MERVTVAADIARCCDWLYSYSSSTHHNYITIMLCFMLTDIIMSSCHHVVVMIDIMSDRSCFCYHRQSLLFPTERSSQPRKERRSNGSGKYGQKRRPRNGGCEGVMQAIDACADPQKQTAASYFSFTHDTGRCTQTQLARPSSCPFSRHRHNTTALFINWWCYCRKSEGALLFLNVSSWSLLLAFR